MSDSKDLVSTTVIDELRESAFVPDAFDPDRIEELQALLLNKEKAEEVTTALIASDGGRHALARHISTLKSKNQVAEYLEVLEDETAIEIADVLQYQDYIRVLRNPEASKEDLRKAMEEAVDNYEFLIQELMYLPKDRICGLINLWGAEKIFKVFGDVIFELDDIEDGVDVEEDGVDVDEDGNEPDNFILTIKDKLDLYDIPPSRVIMKCPQWKFDGLHELLCQIYEHDNGLYTNLLKYKILGGVGSNLGLESIVEEDADDYAEETGQTPKRNKVSSIHDIGSSAILLEGIDMDPEQKTKLEAELKDMDEQSKNLDSDGVDGYGEDDDPYA